MGILDNKHVLLFAPRFFGYESAIKKALEDEGAVVFLYDERPNPTEIEKMLIRKARFLMKHKIDKYYSEINEKEKNTAIDYIFFVNSEAVDRQSIMLFKKTHPNAKFFLYMWDSARNKHIKQYFNLFDGLFSFDSEDCSKYGMRFRPLFFIPTFETRENDNQNNDYKYDLSFVGTVHSDRATILLKVLEECKGKGYRYYLYLYTPGRMMFFLRMLTNPSLRRMDKEYIHIAPLSKEKYKEISEQTRCVIDIEHPKQTGLTMRTIEMLGVRKKMITTNKEVTKYDFYNESNQIVINRNKVIIDKDVIRKPYEDVPEEIYNKYSIKGWVNDIFGGEA